MGPASMQVQHDGLSMLAEADSFADVGDSGVEGHASTVLPGAVAGLAFVLKPILLTTGLAAALVRRAQARAVLVSPHPQHRN